MLWKSYFSMYLIHYHEGQITNLMFKNFTGSCWRAKKWVPSISRNVCWRTSTGSAVDLSSSSLGCFLQKVIRKIPSKDKSKLLSYEKKYFELVNLGENIEHSSQHSYDWEAFRKELVDFKYLWKISWYCQCYNEKLSYFVNCLNGKFFY